MTKRAHVHYSLVGAAVISIGGCATDGAGAGDLGGPSDEVLAKADYAPEGDAIVGEVGNGVHGPVDYTGEHSIMAYSFHAVSGDIVNIFVRSEDGDAFAFLLDEGFDRLAKNDDQDGLEGTNAHIRFRIPHTGTYYAGFRELDLDPASFTIEIKGLSVPVPETLAEFQMLSDEEKMKALYPGHTGSGEELLGLREGFEEVDIRFVDELAGHPEALDRMHEAYREAFGPGIEGRPSVTKIVRNGETYAYAVSASGSYYSGSWGHTNVYDLDVMPLGGFGYSE